MTMMRARPCVLVLVIALSQRMAEAEAQLQAAEQQGAQHRRRIDTQLLTLHFQPPGSEAGRNDIVQVLRDFGGIVSMGTAWMIRAAAFLIPLVLVIALLVTGVRKWRAPRRTKGLAMQARRWLLGLALLAGAPAMAACPPAGQDRAGLQALKSAGFAVADAAGKRALAMGLIGCLGDPDPVLRDGIAYEALQHWMRAGDFDAVFLRRLRDALYARLDAPDPNGVWRPFAALVLAEVARTDRVAPWMSPAEREALLARAATYLGSVRDYRGFEAGIGWRHGVAHGADWLLQLSLNPALDAAQLRRILDAVALQAVPDAGHAYVFGEPDRLVQPVAYVARRGVLTDADWQAWLEGLSRRLGPMPAGGDQAWLARRHDLVAFLSALYIQVDSSQNEALRALKPHVAKAMGGGG